jgi:hypothetical protein
VGSPVRLTRTPGAPSVYVARRQKLLTVGLGADRFTLPLGPLRDPILLCSTGAKRRKGGGDILKTNIMLCPLVSLTVQCYCTTVYGLICGTKKRSTNHKDKLLPEAIPCQPKKFTVIHRAPRK